MNRFAFLSIPVALAFLAAPSVLRGAESGPKTWAIKAETPQALLAVYNRAVSQKDWRTCFLCDDPELRGDFFQRTLYAAAVGKDTELGAILGKWLKLAPARSDGNFPNIRQDDRVPDGVLFYEAFGKRVDDLPAFAVAVARRFEAMGETPFLPRSNLQEIKIKGNMAMGYELPAALSRRRVWPGNHPPRRRGLLLEANPMSPSHRTRTTSPKSDGAIRCISAKSMATGISPAVPRRSRPSSAPRYCGRRSNRCLLHYAVIIKGFRNDTSS